MLLQGGSQTTFSSSILAEMVNILNNSPNSTTMVFANSCGTAKYLEELLTEHQVPCILLHSAMRPAVSSLYLYYILYISIIFSISLLYSLYLYYILYISIISLLYSLYLYYIHHLDNFVSSFAKERAGKFAAFQNGEQRVLVSSDVASRGLDTHNVC